MAEAKNLISVQGGKDRAAEALPGLPAAELLLEIREIAGMRLAQLLPSALSLSATSLYRLSEQAIDMDKRLLYMEAGQLAQYRLGNLPRDFRRHFEQRYLRACKRDPLRRRSLMDDFDVAQLCIVVDDRLEDPLSADELIKALDEGCQEPLYDLGKRFQILLGDSSIASLDLPIGPRVLGKALVDALGDQCAGTAPKVKLLQALGRHLPALLQEVYRDLLGHIDRQLADSAYMALLEGQGLTLPAVDLPTEAWLGSRAHGPCPSPAAAGPVVVQDAPPTRSTEWAALARDAVALRTGRHPLPESIRRFLHEHWQAWLQTLIERHGPHSEALQGALATMDDLIRSLKPTPAKDRNFPLQRLASLLRRLDEGMAGIGASAETRDLFFTQLMEAEAEAHLPALPAASEAETPDAAVAASPPPPASLPAEAIAADPTQAPQTEAPVLPASDLPAMQENTRTGPVNTTLHAERAHPAAATRAARLEDLERDLEALLNQSERLTLFSDSPAPGAAKEDAEPPRAHAPASDPTAHERKRAGAARRAAARALGMKRGTRLILRLEDGSSSEVKLAWISPCGSTLFFTNPGGQRALSLTAEQLSNQFRDGHARLLEAAGQPLSEVPPNAAYPRAA